MDKIKCDCLRKAKDVCIKHKVSVCDKHISKHTKCTLIKVEVFQKDILKKKEDTLIAIQNFKKERIQLLFKLKRDNEAQSRNLLEKNSLISDLLEKIIDLNKIKKRTYFKNTLDFKYEDIISDLEKKNNIFEIQNILNKKETKLMQQRFLEKSKELNLVMKEDLMTKTLLNIFEKITKNYKDTVEHLLGCNFFAPKDFIEASTKINKIIFKDLFKNNSTSKNQKEKKNSKLEFTITQIKIGIINKKKERRDTMNTFISDSSEIIDLRAGKTEILDANFIENRGISNSRDTKGRDTLLIYNNMFESSLNPRKGKIKIKRNSEQVKKINKLEDLNEDDELDLEDDGSLMDFEEENFNLESDEEIENDEDYLLNFNNLKTKICIVMDQVLYDMNCVNFFDKNQRGRINDYFDSFLKVLGNLLLDLKTNFSKMQ